MSDREMRKFLKEKKPKTTVTPTPDLEQSSQQPDPQPEVDVPPRQQQQKKEKPTNRASTQSEDTPQPPEEKTEKNPFTHDHLSRNPSTSAGPSDHPRTFFPDEVHYPLPFSAFNSFNFKADDQCFNDYTNRELVLATAIHQGRALATFSRLLGRESRKGGSDASLKKLKTKYKGAKAERKKTEKEKVELQNTVLALQQEAARANEIKIKALEEQSKLKEENATIGKKLQEQADLNQELKNNAEQMVAEAQRQHATLNNSLRVINELERANEHLKAQARSGTPELRQQIIEEYQASPDLLDRILEQFGKGYQAAIDKAAKAGIDPNVFTDSDDSADA